MKRSESDFKRGGVVQRHRGALQIWDLQADEQGFVPLFGRLGAFSEFGLSMATNPVQWCHERDCHWKVIRMQIYRLSVI